MSLEKYISSITCKFYEGGIVDYKYKIKNTNLAQDISTIEPAVKTVKINKNILSFKDYINNYVSIKPTGDFNIIPSKIVVKGNNEVVVYDKANNIDIRDTFAFAGTQESGTEYEVLFTYEKVEEQLCKVTLKVNETLNEGTVTPTEVNVEPNTTYDDLFEEKLDVLPNSGCFLYMITRVVKDGDDVILYKQNRSGTTPEIDITRTYKIDTDMTFEYYFKKIEEKCKVVLKVNEDADSGTVNPSEFEVDEGTLFKDILEKTDVIPDEGYFNYIIRRKVAKGEHEVIFEQRDQEEAPVIDLRDTYVVDDDMEFEFGFAKFGVKTIDLHLTKTDQNITELKQNMPITKGLTLLQAIDEGYLTITCADNYILKRIKSTTMDEVIYDYINGIDKRDQYTLETDAEILEFSSMLKEKQINVWLLNKAAGTNATKFRKPGNEEDEMDKKVHIYDNNAKNLTYYDLLRNYDEDGKPIIWDNIVFNQEYGGEDKIKLKKVQWENIETGEVLDILDYEKDIYKLGHIINFGNEDRYRLKLEWELRDTVKLKFWSNNREDNDGDGANQIRQVNVGDYFDFGEIMKSMEKYRDNPIEALTKNDLIRFTEEGDIDVIDTVIGYPTEGYGANYGRKGEVNFYRWDERIYESQDYYACYTCYEPDQEDKFAFAYPVIFNVVYPYKKGGKEDTFACNKSFVCYVRSGKQYATISRVFSEIRKWYDGDTIKTFKFKGFFEYEEQIKKIGTKPMKGNNDYTNILSLDNYTWEESQQARVIDVVYEVE